MRAKNMQSLTDDTKRRHPGVVIYGVGDEAHKLRYSDHNEDDTVGSKAPQSDADNVPEHRAIDVMLGPAFSKAQAYAYINDLLADPAALKRLKYIIFDGNIWSRSNGWKRVDFDGDPHTDHVHLSGDAADDENAAGWPAVYGGDMTITDADAAKIALKVWSWDLLNGPGTDPAYVVLNRTEGYAQTAAEKPPAESAPVDVAALVLALTPVIREVVREELDKTKLGGTS